MLKETETWIKPPNAINRTNTERIRTLNGTEVYGGKSHVSYSHCPNESWIDQLAHKHRGKRLHMSRLQI